MTLAQEQGFVISDDKALLNIDKVYRFLTEHSTWALGIPKVTVETAIANSVCLAAYLGDEQIAFCRIITDHATFANLVDVIVWPEYRGLGVSKMLMKAVLGHPSITGVRRFTLATSNAHGLYRQFGFTALSKPDTFMEIYNPAIYTQLG
ncbi:GNAT family N-acetyltransferase [Pseudoalteromonas fenneropenaei]|uniref:GNAT family N-acetyltransferase n=1 Tax=Pseudoalteromonas fenneropenaei TaxID=1737459 RepID=A0ABV7CFD6_9GAMM